VAYCYNCFGGKPHHTISDIATVHAVYIFSSGKPDLSFLNYFKISGEFFSCHVLLFYECLANFTLSSFLLLAFLGIFRALEQISAVKTMILGAKDIYCIVYLSIMWRRYFRNLCCYDMCNAIDNQRIIQSTPAIFSFKS
jgi:hypothetical protein